MSYLSAAARAHNRGHARSYRAAISADSDKQFRALIDREKTLKRKIYSLLEEAKSLVFSIDGIGLIPIVMSVVAFSPQAISTIVFSFGGYYIPPGRDLLIIWIGVRDGICALILIFHSWIVLSRLLRIWKDICYWGNVKWRELHWDVRSFGEKTEFGNDQWFRIFSTSENGAILVLEDNGITGAEREEWYKSRQKFRRLRTKMDLLKSQVSWFRLKYFTAYFGLLSFYLIVLGGVFGISYNLCLN